MACIVHLPDAQLTCRFSHLIEVHFLIRGHYFDCSGSPKKRQIEAVSSEEMYDGGEDGELDSSGRRKSPRPRHLILARQHSSNSTSSEEDSKEQERYGTALIRRLMKTVETCQFMQLFVQFLIYRLIS